MEIRESNITDWEKLQRFFSTIYRQNHPLQNQAFWNWQYGDPNYGRSFICLNENHEIVGHVGANFGGGLAWIINVYLNEEFRGKGILTQLYALARNYYPLAATAANEAGLGLYKNMQWIRYYDLVRFVKINPTLSNQDFPGICQPISINIDNIRFGKTHYFQQPGIKGVALGDSTGVSQEQVGGLRVVDLGNLSELEQKAWEIGYSWIDYITSWNDLKTAKIEKNGWLRDYKSVVPWRLNPVEKDYFCDITFLSERPLDNNFIVHRSYSDHGRVGSL